MKLPKLIYLAAVLFSLQSMAQNLFFSEYIEGSSSNKALEIYNNTGANINLTGAGYEVRLFSNGATTATNTLTLTGMLSNNSTLVIANSTANANILALASVTSAVSNYNGDDAVGLFQNGVLIDVIGQIGFRPSSPGAWVNGSVSTLDKTLRRKSGVCQGYAVTSAAFDPAVQWDVYNQDDISNLGAHTATCGAPSDASSITGFTLGNTNALILGNIINVTVPFGTNLVNVAPNSITISPSATVSPSAAIVRDFTSAVTYTVTAQNLTSTGIYTVNASVAPENVSDNTITGFTAQNQLGSTISGNNIMVSFSANTIITSLSVAGVIAFNATANPSFSAVQNFSNPFTYTITAKNFSTNVYTVTSVIVSVPAVNLTPIHTVQGSGAATTLGASTVFTTTGVVTADYQGTNQLRGFYIQDETGDGNDQTSDGIFVFTNAAPIAVTVGQKLMIAANAAEFRGNTQLTNPVLIQVISSGNVIAPKVVTLPAISTTDFERYEGMLITIPQQMTIAQNFFLGRFGRMILSSNGRTINPTNQIDPNDVLASGTSTSGTSNVAAITAALDLNRRRSIVLEDNSTVQNPAITPYIDPVTKTVRSGSTVVSLTGIVDFFSGTSFEESLYRIQPLPNTTVNFNYAPRPTVPGVGGSNVKIGALNVLNYFNGDGTGSTAGFTTSEQRGADNLTEFNRQKAKVIAAISALNADIVGIMEIENDGEGANHAITDLVSSLNLAMGANTYNFVTVPGVAGKLGTDAIKVGLLYKPATIDLIGNSIADNAAIHSRPPLAQIFRLKATGAKFMVVSNHMKSKSPSGSTGVDADQGDGQGAWNDKRKQQAAATATFAANTASANGISDYLLIGDINAYEQEDPIDIFRAAGLETLVNNSYSFVFDGAAGSLDHAISSATLAAKVTGAHKWHNNADEPQVLDYNTEFNPTILYDAGPYRASDHDALIIGFNLPVPALQNLTVTALNATKVYGQANPMFTYTVAGLQTSDVISVSYSTTANSVSGVGKYPISISVSGASLANYALTTIAGQLTISQASLSVVGVNATRIYGQVNPSFTSTTVGLVNGDNVSVSFSTLATSISGVGTYPISISVSSASLANYALTTIAGQLTISQASLSVVGVNATRTYGQVNPSFTSTTVGLVNGDNFSVGYVTAATSVSGVGNYPITLFVSGSSLNNYSLITLPAQLTVTKAAQTANQVLSIPTLTVKGTNFTITGLTASAGLPFVFSSSDLTVLSINGSSLLALNVGIVTVTAFQAGDANYLPLTVNSIVNVVTVVSGTGTSTITGLDNFAPKADKQFTVYPNPANEVLNIKTEKGGLVEILSLDGKILVSENITAGISTLNLNLTQGIYLLKFNNDYIKLVIE